MGILLGVYHLMLRGEKMYTFNRFYLLFSLCFALVIPFIQIETTPETVPFSEITTLHELVPQPSIATFNEIPPAANNIFFPFFFYFIYGTIALIFLFRFVKNLSALSAKIKSNPTVNYKKAKLVLLNEKLLPYTFLHYVFVNREDYYHQRIEKELFEHELAHVYQRHSLDILFIELLKIVGWFHPLVYLFEKAIKLNHEFLADASVIRSYQDISVYQHILLNKASRHTPSHLISSLNFSLTKKRFMMMTKKISPVQVILKKAALAPLFLLLVIAFTTKILAQETNKDQKSDTKEAITSKKTTDVRKDLTREDSLRIKNKYFKNSSMWTVRKNEDGTYTKITYHEMTDEEKLRVPMPGVPEKNPPTQDQLNAWIDPSKYGVWLDGERIENTTLKNYQPSDLGNYFVSSLTKTAKNYGKHDFQVNIMTLSYFEEWQEKMSKAWEIEE